jgi:hypothetical protein
MVMAWSLLLVAIEKLNWHANLNMYSIQGFFIYFPLLRVSVFRDHPLQCLSGSHRAIPTKLVSMGSWSSHHKSEEKQD